MKIVELTKENFDEEVLAASMPVLIDFWATWCRPCQMQSPVVDAVAEEMGDKVKVCKVNVDEQPKLAMNYQIASIPTLVYMKHGQFKSRMVGLQDQETITDYLNQLLATEE
ncbi:MAG: thioredoxin [Blautia sp.]|nr:thioredoxin [Blautia sp.]